ncbi:hypothetical protein H4Q26_008002 [Puccinia striiformis f. sp. tritici PST-130]|nr:hypothetical protein H4Q26_008002 [Puccinia striiformis f. sp. tritici PST-130]
MTSVFGKTGDSASYVIKSILFTLLPPISNVRLTRSRTSFHLISIDRITIPFSDNQPFPCKNTPTQALTPDLDTNLLDLVILSSLISANHRRSIVRITTSFSMTPVENQNLIQHYLTIVKQQRADNPPPPPFVDPLTSDERLDGIIKNVLADQEAELDHKIFFNQSLREYRKVKKMEAIARRDSIYEFMIHLTSELLNDPRPTLHSQDFDAVYFKKKFEKENLATFNIRFERYQEALVHAQEIEVQATQTKDKTVIPTTKVLKIETRPAPIEKPIPKVTSNIHLDKHLAKTTITKKLVSKTVDKPIKKKLLPLESTLGDSSISSFTTEPYFEDLEPTTSLPSPFLKKIALKKRYQSHLTRRNLPISPPLPGRDRRRSNKPDLEPLHPDPERRAKQARRSNQGPQNPKETSKHPGSLGIIREPLSSDESRASSEMESESESEDEIPEAEIIRILIKKQVKIHAKYLKAISNDDKKTILDQAQQNQLVLQKLIPNKEIESYVSGWNPWVEKKKVFSAPPKNKKRPKSDKRSRPRQSGSNRPDQSHSNNRSQARLTNSRNQASSDRGRNQGRSNNNHRPGYSNNQGSNKRPREESEDLKDAVRWAKVHRATAVLGAFFRHTKRDLPPHQTPLIKEEDDRGPRLTEKEVGKLLPPLTEWVTFSGEGEYDYIEFIQYCDLILETYWAKEDIVVVRLPRLFKGVAKVWWKTKSAAMGKASWQTWKDLMKAQFNTSTWRSKMKEAFRKEKLDPSVHVISTWCVAQHRRLECISPGLSMKEVNEEILERCPGTLANSVTCRIPDLNVDLTVLINTMEDIINTSKVPSWTITSTNLISTQLLTRGRPPTPIPINHSTNHQRLIDTDTHPLSKSILFTLLPPISNDNNPFLCKSTPTRALTFDPDTNQHDFNTPTQALTPDLDTNLLDLVILSSLISANHRRSIVRITTSFSMTPVENQNLIQHYLTIVKQQRADNPPPPPFVDPLTSDERLDGIIKNVLADQEAELDHKIFFNQSLREYRKVKKMEAIARRDSIYEFMIHLTSELLNDPRPTLHSQDFDAVYFKKKFEKENLATFNIRFERYQEALVHAQEIEVQATQTKDKTVIPTTKVLKIETRPAPIEKPIPKVTSNIHLDKHLAKTTITKKLVSKTVDKPIKKKLLPLESTLGDSSISSFTTEPYFEDLEPTTSLPSPFLKKIALKKEVPVTSDSESELDIENFKKPTNQPSSPVLKKIASRKTLLTLSDSEDEIDEDPINPILNPSTLIRKDEQSKLDDPIKVLKTPKETSKHPGSLGIIREPLSSDESRASSEMESESESEDEIPEAEIIRILIKKQVKIHAKYLKAISNDDKKTILDQAQQNQLVLQKLIPNKEIESYVSGWNPWVEKKKVFSAPPKNKKRPKSDKRSRPRQSGSNRPDQSHSNNRSQARLTNSRNQASSDRGRNQGRSNNNHRPGYSNNQGSNKRPREESEDLKDAVRWAKVHRATAVLGAFFRHTKSLRIEIKSLTDIASVLSQAPTPDNSADILEKMEQSEASIISNVKQDLITEVRVYVRKEVETLTTTVTTSFEGIMTQLRNMEQSNNEKFNALQHNIVEIRKEIISVDNRVAKAESSRMTSPLAYSSQTPLKTVVETENNNPPSRDLPPHQTPLIKEEDDRGPRLTEKEVGKLLPPLTEWTSLSSLILWKISLTQ